MNLNTNNLYNSILVHSCQCCCRSTSFYLYEHAYYKLFYCLFHVPPSVTLSIYLVSLCLQSVVKCPGLLELLVELVHLLLVLFLQTLPLLLKLC